jgi:hypothetical protein
MMRWEYTFLFWTVGEQCFSEINVLGQDGWELVSPVSTHDGILFVFKRPAPSVADMQPGNGRGAEGMETGVWLNRSQVARVLGLTPTRVNQLARSGKLAHQLTPLGRLFSEETVRAAVAEREAQRRYG